MIRRPPKPEAEQAAAAEITEADADLAVARWRRHVREAGQPLLDARARAERRDALGDA